MERISLQYDNFDRARLARPEFEQPFRVHLLCHDGLDGIQVVARVPRADLLSETVPAGYLRGRGELLAFVRGVQLDSIVDTEQLGDGVDLSFRRTFHVTSPEELVAFIEAQLNAARNATLRILEGLSPESKELVYREDFILGASMLGSAEGARRMSEWFSKRSSDGPVRT
jgi:hypothetical protein